MNLKRILFWAAVLLIGYMLIHQPTQSAATVQHMLSWLQNAAQSIITFVGKVFA